MFVRLSATRYPLSSPAGPVTSSLYGPAWVNAQSVWIDELYSPHNASPAPLYSVARRLVDVAETRLSQARSPRASPTVQQLAAAPGVMVPPAAGAEIGAVESIELQPVAESKSFTQNVYVPARESLLE